MIEYKRIAELAKIKSQHFSSLIEGVPYEAKGILYSEILFMLASIGDKVPVRILESGRARGQSTLLLAKALPDTEILSIEFNEDSPDVAVAESRLRSYDNVQLLFGDAREMLPKIIQNGDIVIIDGPKMFLAVRLALSLLSTGKAAYVFIHDTPKGTTERSFLDLFMPECRFSDHRGVAEVTHDMDREVGEMLPVEQKLEGFHGNFGYGFTLACIPHVKNRSYHYLLVMALVYDIAARLRRSVLRFLSTK